MRSRLELRYKKRNPSHNSSRVEAVHGSRQIRRQCKRWFHGCWCEMHIILVWNTYKVHAEFQIVGNARLTGQNIQPACWCGWTLAHAACDSTFMLLVRRCLGLAQVYSLALDALSFDAHAVAAHASCLHSCY